MNEQILKLPEVKKITGLSGSSIYRGIARGTFPKQISLSERSSGWLRSEIDAWIMKRVEVSRMEVSGEH